MWQNGLLCAHYVDRKWVVWGLFWVNFAVVPRCWGHEVPCWRCFGQGGPRNAIWGMGSCRAFVGGVALKFFALQALDSARLALFLPRAGAFMWVYVAVSAGGFYVFLCGSLYPPPAKQWTAAGALQ